VAKEAYELARILRGGLADIQVRLIDTLELESEVVIELSRHRRVVCSPRVPSVRRRSLRLIASSGGQCYEPVCHVRIAIGWRILLGVPEYDSPVTRQASLL
jgi:hypothetical protein